MEGIHYLCSGNKAKRFRQEVSSSFYALVSTKIENLTL